MTSLTDWLKLVRLTKVDTRNPFEVYERVKRDRAAAKASLYAFVYRGHSTSVDDPIVKQITDSLESMAQTMRAVENVCHARVLLEYWRELNKLRWWEFRKRRNLLDGSEQWKRDRFTELREEARKKELEWK